MNVHSTERSLKFYAAHGWSKLTVSQVSSMDAIIETREDGFGPYHTLKHGTINLDALMFLVSKVHHFRLCNFIVKRKYREYLSTRLKGWADEK